MAKQSGKRRGPQTSKQRHAVWGHFADRKDLLVPGLVVALILGLALVVVISNLVAGSSPSATGLRIGPLRQYALNQPVPGLINATKPSKPISVTAPEQVSTPTPGLIDSVNQATQLVTGSFAPDGAKTDVSEGIVTPPGAGWWTFVTSAAPSVGLAHAAAPKGASWYAATTQNSLTNLHGVDTTYGAIEIGFDTHAEATRYANATIAGPDGNGSFPAVIDNLVIFAPSWANPNDQPIPTSVKGVIFHPKAANWVVDFGRQDAQLAQVATTPVARTAMSAVFKDLGFTDNTLWNAMADSPQGPWVGELTDYDPSAINFGDAGSELSSTSTTVCQGAPGTSGNNSCVQSNPGLMQILNVGCWQAGVVPANQTAQLCTNTNLLPNIAPTSAVVLKFGFEANLMRGIIDGTQTALSGSVAMTQGWITKDSQGNYVMTRVMVPGAAPAMSLAPSTPLIGSN